MHGKRSLGIYDKIHIGRIRDLQNMIHIGRTLTECRAKSEKRGRIHNTRQIDGIMTLDYISGPHHARVFGRVAKSRFAVQGIRFRSQLRSNNRFKNHGSLSAL